MKTRHNISKDGRDMRRLYGNMDYLRRVDHHFECQASQEIKPTRRSETVHVCR